MLGIMLHSFNSTMERKDRADKQKRYSVLGTMPSYNFHCGMGWKDKAHKTGEIREGRGRVGGKGGGKEENKRQEKRNRRSMAVNSLALYSAVPSCEEFPGFQGMRRA